MAAMEKRGARVLCLPYTGAKKALHAEDPLHLRQLGADARTVYEPGSGVYLTVWDDEKGIPARRRFTLAHEAGHIALGHFTDFRETDLHRTGLSGRERAVLEAEADCFAAELLCPGVLIREVLGDCDASVIAAVFGVSMQCAESRARECAKGGEAPSVRDAGALLDSERAVLHLFRDGLERMEIPAPACERCGTVIPRAGQRYCAGCGAALTGTAAGKRRGGRLPERYPPRTGDLPLQDGSAGGAVPVPGAAYCLSCGHAVPGGAGEECPFCGAALLNRCLRCGRIWPDGYAFCPDCGMECALRSRAEENRRREAEMERRYPPTDFFRPFPRLRYARAEALRRGNRELAGALRCARLMVTPENDVLLICASETDRKTALRKNGDLLDILDEFAPRHNCIGIYADGADLSGKGEADGKAVKPGKTKKRPRRERPETADAVADDAALPEDTADALERDEINAILSGI